MKKVWLLIVFSVLFASTAFGGDFPPAAPGSSNVATTYSDSTIDNLLNQKQNDLDVYSQAEAEDSTETSEGILTPQGAHQAAHQMVEDNYGWRVALSSAPASGDQWLGMPCLFEGYTAGGSSADPADEHSDGYDGAYWAYCSAIGTPGTWVCYLRVPSMVIPGLLVPAPTPDIDDPDNWTLTGYGKWVANAAGSASLPAVAEGMHTVIQVRGAYVAVIDPNGTEEVFLNGVTCGAGVSIQSEGDNDGENVALSYSAAGDWDAIANGWECTP